MVKIGIIKCIHANDVCTGAGCLKAFFHRTDFFAEYGPEAELVAFMGCNGCEKEQPLQPREDPGIREKVERLVKERVQIMHVGVCRIQENGEECERLLEIQEMMEELGITIKKGTHREG